MPAGSIDSLAANSTSTLDLRFFALRRCEPTCQPLLGEVPFEPPDRWYR